MFATGAALSCLAVLPSNSASAQSTFGSEPVDTAGNRPQPDYDVLGIRTGNFRIYPQLAVTGTYDDNVFAREVEVESGFSATIVPSISVQWSRPSAQVTLGGNVQLRRYAELDGQDDEQYSVNAAASYEVSSSTNLSANAGWGLATVDRGTFENGLQVGDPLQQERFNAGFSARHRFNRLFLTGTVSGESFDFDDVMLDDGTIIDQSFRNGSRIGGRLGAGYEIGPKLSIVVNGDVNRFDYDDEGSVIQRDATGYLATAGIRYELSELLIAELGAGYRNHNFDDPTVSDIGGFTPSAMLRWYPTPLLSIRFDLTHSTTTNAYDSISAVSVTSGKLSVDYEFLRNLIITAGTDTSYEDYGPTDGTSRLFSVYGRVSWKANRVFRLNGTIDYERRSSSDISPIPEFDSLRVMLTAVLAR